MKSQTDFQTMASVLHWIIIFCALITAETAAVRGRGDRKSSKIWPAAAHSETYDPNATIFPVFVFDETTTVLTCHGKCSDVTEAFLNATLKRFCSSLEQIRSPSSSSSMHLSQKGHPRRPRTAHNNSIDSRSLYKQSRTDNVAYISVSLGSADTHLRHGVDERYRLSISKDAPPTINITAGSIFGASNAFSTLLQLVSPVSFRGDNISTSSRGLDRDGWVFWDAPLKIVDGPAFPYRGLLIDTSRHYLKEDLIYQTLDAMALNKLNVLHWHMTDSQSWPYASQRFPELAEKGAYHPDQVYTISNITKIVQYGAERGIRVVPELDLPGHSKSIGVSHPEFMCGGKGQEPLDATRGNVYKFVSDLYDELMTVFPSDLIHVGGDEVSLDCYRNDSSIQAWLHQHNLTEKGLWGLFEKWLLTLVAGELERRPIVWQEVFDANITLPENTIVDVWKEWLPTSRHNATLKHDVIFSACWYLDHLDRDWWGMYQCNPLAFNGTRQQHRHIIGGHASMWGERVDGTNFLSRTWPRASSMAEVLWTGPNTTVILEETVAQRLSAFRCLMIQLGIPASPIQPGTCSEAPNTEAMQA